MLLMYSNCLRVTENVDDFMSLFLDFVWLVCLFWLAYLFFVFWFCSFLNVRLFFLFLFLFGIFGIIWFVCLFWLDYLFFVICFCFFVMWVRDEMFVAYRQGMIQMFVFNGIVRLSLFLLSFLFGLCLWFLVFMVLMDKMVKMEYDIVELNSDMIIFQIIVIINERL